MIDRSFVEKIEEMVVTKDLVREIDGKNFSWRQLHEIEENFYYPNYLGSHTLQGLADYIKIVGSKETKDKLFCQVLSPSEVHVVSELDDRMQRRKFMCATCATSQFDYGKYKSIDHFIIGVQASFEQDIESKQLIQLLGNIEAESKIITEDDGTTQTVTAKTGISLKQEVQLPNPVILKSYRTFAEIPQPPGKYILRIEKRSNVIVAALFETDDPLWAKATAEAIKAWLKDNVDVPVIG